MTLGQFIVTAISWDHTPEDWCFWNEVYRLFTHLNVEFPTLKYSEWDQNTEYDRFIHQLYLLLKQCQLVGDLPVLIYEYVEEVATKDYPPLTGFRYD